MLIMKTIYQFHNVSVIMDNNFLVTLPLKFFFMILVGILVLQFHVVVSFCPSV